MQRPLTERHGTRVLARKRVLEWSALREEPLSSFTAFAQPHCPVVRATAIASPSWMLLRLGLETQQHHATADTDRIALMESASVVDYRSHLARIYGFEAPVETALTTILDAALVRDHMKAHWLRQDLRTLGLTTDMIDHLPHNAARFSSAPQALGWLFVIERHSLVSGLIARQLSHRFGDGLPDAMAYLSAYGETPGARFRSLCLAIDQIAVEHAVNPTQIVAAACDAFRAQRQWYLAAVHENPTSRVGFTPDRSTLSS